MLYFSIFNFSGAKYLRAARRFALAAALSAAALSAGCAATEQAGQAPNRSAGSSAAAANIARFTAPAAADEYGTPPEQVIKRAAALSLQRNYAYFILAQEHSGQKTAARPHFGLSYGRQPYGFGDAGASSGFAPSLGFSFSPSFAKRPKTETTAEWLVYMLNSADKQAILALSAGKNVFGATAYVYNARSGALRPIAVRLRP